MGIFFSKKRKKAPLEDVTTQDRSMLDLKVARDKLKRYQKQLDIETTKLTQQAQQLVREGRKDRALVLLKIKRYKLQQVARSDTHLFSVLQLIDTLDWSTQQKEVIDALREGTAALNALHAEMPIEEVEKLMEDSQEAVAYEAEVSRVLGGGLTEESEEDILEEFESLQAELSGGKTAETVTTKTETKPTPIVVETPAIPVSVAETDDDVLAKLEALHAKMESDGVGVLSRELSREESIAAAMLPEPPTGPVYAMPDVPTHEPLQRQTENREPAALMPA